MKNKIRRLFIADMLCFAGASVAIMLISLTEKFSGVIDSVFSIIVALLFWISILSGILVYRMIVSKIKILEEKVPNLKKKAYQKLPGILTFRIDKLRIALYSAIVAGLLFIISDSIFHYVNEFIMFAAIAATVYLIIVHCIVNSKCFNIYSMMKSPSKK